MSEQKSGLSWYRRLLKNNRFWILAIAVTASVYIAAFTQAAFPPGSLRTIRMEQSYGFISLALLYVALLASPLTRVFPWLPGKVHYLHARRAIGISAFYYAALHAYITFFQQLGGFQGIKYLNRTYSLSLLGGVFAVAVLLLMAATSFDRVVDKIGYRRWKLLHRLVYSASLAILLHIILIGPHYDNGPSALGVLTYVAAAALVVLEALRFRIYIIERKAKRG